MKENISIKQYNYLQTVPSLFAELQILQKLLFFAILVLNFRDSRKVPSSR